MTTKTTLARLHALSFSTPRPWSATEFRDLLSTPHTFLLTEGKAFLMGRVVTDEAELLTIAVPPDLRGRGIAKRLVSAFINESRQRGASSAFLEVAEDNRPARHIYANAGFVESGSRRNYYRSPEGNYINAIFMICALH